MQQPIQIEIFWNSKLFFAFLRLPQNKFVFLLSQMALENQSIARLKKKPDGRKNQIMWKNAKCKSGFRIYRHPFQS